MTIKRRMIIKGNVQLVGFRLFIKKLAMNLNIKGSVKNLPDGNVEIYCECDENIYEKFKNAIIEKKADPREIMKINVTDVEENDEDWEKFNNSRIKEYFYIDYDNLDIQKELLERTEIGILSINNMNSNLSEKIDNTNQNTKDIDQHMNENFINLDKKYDEFGQSMKRLELDIHEMKDAFIKLTAHFTKDNSR